MKLLTLKKHIKIGISKFSGLNVEDYTHSPPPVTQSLSQKIGALIIKILYALLKIVPLSAFTISGREHFLVMLVDHCQNLLPPQHQIYNTKDITMTLQKINS